MLIKICEPPELGWPVLAIEMVIGSFEMGSISLRSIRERPSAQRTQEDELTARTAAAAWAGAARLRRGVALVRDVAAVARDGGAVGDRVRGAGNRAARARARRPRVLRERASELAHEPLDHAVEREAIVESRLREVGKVAGGDGQLIREELRLEVALRRAERRVRRHALTRQTSRQRVSSSRSQLISVHFKSRVRHGRQEAIQSGPRRARTITELRDTAPREFSIAAPRVSAMEAVSIDIIVGFDCEGRRRSRAVRCHLLLAESKQRELVRAARAYSTQHIACRRAPSLPTRSRRRGALRWTSLRTLA